MNWSLVTRLIMNIVLNQNKYSLAIGETIAKQTPNSIYYTEMLANIGLFTKDWGLMFWDCIIIKGKAA